MNYAEESLKLHEQWNGKIEVISRVKLETRDDLSLAYTPGVAQPCLELQTAPQFLDLAISVLRPECLLWRASVCSLKLSVMSMLSPSA